MPMSAPPEPLLAAFLLLGAALAPTANGAPTSYYGVQLPDPLHVYTLQETKPENIHNDPFLVVFKTHIPSLRPYEIPYFPSKDLSSEEQDENSVPLIGAGSTPKQEQTTVIPPPEPMKDQGSGASADNTVKSDEQIDLEKLPELVELKPEALLEAIDASKQDAEESVTAHPEDPTTFLSDAPSNSNKDSAEKSDSEKQELENSASKTKEKIDDNSFKKKEEKENNASDKDDSNSPPQTQTEKDESTLNTLENNDNNKEIQKENEDKENSTLDVDRVEKENSPKEKEK